MFSKAGALLGFDRPRTFSHWYTVARFLTLDLRLSSGPQGSLFAVCPPCQARSMSWLLLWLPFLLIINVGKRGATWEQMEEEAVGDAAASQKGTLPAS